jgi:hypothetical protein
MHDLRHTYASKLIKRGVPILSVARLLGHQTIDMTLRYAHLAPVGLDEQVAKLDFPRTAGRGPRPRKGDWRPMPDPVLDSRLARTTKSNGDRRTATPLSVSLQSNLSNSSPGRTNYVRGSSRRLIIKSL